jgi:hypothetical protein
LVYALPVLLQDLHATMLFDSLGHAEVLKPDNLVALFAAVLLEQRVLLRVRGCFCPLSWMRFGDLHVPCNDGTCCAAGSSGCCCW